MRESEKSLIPDPAKIKDPGKKALAQVLKRMERDHPDWNFKENANLLNEVRKEKSGLKPESQQQMIRQAYRILEWIGPRKDYGDKAWRDLKALLNEEGYTKNYRRYNFNILKTLAKLTNSKLLGDPPKKPQKREVIANVMPFEVLRDAIRRNKLYDSKDRFCLCLSSVYGLRQVEIRRLKSKNIDRDNHTLEILTAKGNPSKVHYIPLPIREIVENMPIEAKLPRSRAAFQKMFHRIFNPISREIRESTGYKSKFRSKGKEKQNPWGWHSIRRRLVTTLGMIEDDNGDLVFEEDEIRKFLRWTDPHKSMFSSYFSPPKEWKMREEIELDKRIFEYHPFVRLWAKAQRT